MKKKYLFSALLTGSLLLTACNNSSETIVKTTYGDITKEDFYQEMKTTYGENVLRNMVTQKIFLGKYPVEEKAVTEEFDRLKEMQGDQFQQWIEAQGMKDETMLKQAIRAQQAYNALVFEGIEVSEKDMKAEYELMQGEIKAQHILFDAKDKKLALKVKKQLDDGADFDALAKEYSKDEANASKGGDLGYFSHGTHVPEFDEAAFALKPGEISDLVSTMYGYHIIKVNDQRDVENLPSYEELKQEIEMNLKSSRVDEEAVDKRMKKLLEDAKIDIQLDEFKDLMSDMFATDEAIDEPTEESDQ